MRIFSILRNEYVEATPTVDAKTNMVKGYTVGNDNLIEPPELFITPKPKD